MSSSTIPIPPLLPGDLEVSAFQVTRPKVIKDTVTQLVSPSTAVTLNAAAGTVTMVATTLAAGASQAFTVYNSYVGAGVIVLVCIHDITDNTSVGGQPNVIVDNVAEGAFDIVLQNGGLLPIAGGVVKVSFLVV